VWSRLTIISFFLCVLQTLATNILIAIGSLDSLLNAMSAVNWALYGTAFIGLIIMRITEPDRQRPFKVCMLFVVTFGVDLGKKIWSWQWAGGFCWDNSYVSMCRNPDVIV